jgi:hypothetical protein
MAEKRGTMTVAKLSMRTPREQETTFRFDEEERVLWAATTTPRVAARWQKAGYDVRVIGTGRAGTPQSWEVKLPWTGQRRPWVRLIGLSISQWKANTHSGAAGGMRVRPAIGDAA